MLTKEEVEAEKANARAIDARPIKKVAEAKQRKRKRLQVRLACDHLRSSLLGCPLYRRFAPGDLYCHLLHPQ